MLVELHSAIEKTRLAIDHEVIGEVKDLRGTRSWSSSTGNTFIIAKKNRRVHWHVEELYDEVLTMIRGAEARAMPGNSCSGPPGSTAGQAGTTRPAARTEAFAAIAADPAGAGSGP